MQNGLKALPFLIKAKLFNISVFFVSLFNLACREPPALTQLVSLFVTRNYALWKEAEVAKWLESNVREVLRKATDEEDVHQQNKEKYV